MRLVPGLFCKLGVTQTEYRVFRGAFVHRACYDQTCRQISGIKTWRGVSHMFAFLWAIIIGFVAGTVAKLIMPGRDFGGFIVTILLGIGGSVVATWLGRTLGWYQGDQSARFIGSIVGAVIILAIYRFVVRNRGPVAGQG
jgi:uncharacterized membrane protein YeaQ/YmgE (transglycosylase-associated protein family)